MLSNNDNLYETASTSVGQIIARKLKFNKEMGYLDLDCKLWKAAYQAPGIDIYDNKAGAVWCCSECHYAEHNQTTVRRAPVQCGLKMLNLDLTVCCAVGAKCRKNLSNQAKFQN